MSSANEQWAFLDLGAFAGRRPDRRRTAIAFVPGSKQLMRCLLQTPDIGSEVELEATFVLAMPMNLGASTAATRRGCLADIVGRDAARTPSLVSQKVLSAIGAKSIPEV